MSNLSELLPAGAGAKSADFVASGTLGSGVTVVLRSDGKVEAIAESTQTASVGTATQVTPNITESPSLVYDASSGKVVFTYINASNSNYPYAAVGTISGTSISFGTPVVIFSHSVEYLNTAYDSANEKIIVVYRNGANNYGNAQVGTVSGTSISFGSDYTFSGAAIGTGIGIAYDSSNSKFVVNYSATSNSDRGTAIVGTVSGTSITYGSATTYDTEFCNWFGLTYDSANQKVVAINRGGGDIRAYVGTVSGTSISFGSATAVNSGQTGEFNAIGYDVQSGKVVAAYEDRGNSYYGTARVGTVSGTSISFGTPVVFRTANTGNAYFLVGYDASVKRTNIFFRIYSPSNQGLVATGTVSGTSITFDTNFTVASSNRYTGAAYDSVNKKWGYYVRPGANDLDGVVFTTAGTVTNLTDTNFIGITDQAIADTATGAVIVQGGVITNTGLVPDSISANTAAAFAGNVSNAQTRIVYDTANDKAVIAYIDAGNSSYLTAVVGTVSGAAISFGTPVVLQSNEVDSIALTYDENAQKVVVAYKNNVAPFPGRAKVGTVSGTSISFGSAGDFHTGSISGTDATYDSTSQKVILSYGSSAGGHLIVGTISGTSISFGTEYDFTSGSEITQTAVTYDTNAQKVVLAYTDSGNSSYGTAAVGTVSGTSISVGAATVFVNAVVAPVYVKYEPVAQKVVVAYANRGVNPPDWSARVGTVSGTTISFGTETVAGSSGFNGGLTFDTSTGHMIQAYQEASNGTSPVIQISTVSGTDITFGGSLSVSTSTSAAILRIAYDPDTSQVIGINRVDSSSAVGRTFNVNQGLTTKSDYYVQADGSLSTTVSSVPAGRALSSTSILLEG